MELPPSVGRPEKDPEERRSEFVHMRVRPSHKELIELEAQRRNATKSLLVGRIGFEEMQPSGRIVPRPSIREWLLNKAHRLREATEDIFPHHEIHAHEFYTRAREVSKLQEKWQGLWKSAREEKRKAKVGLRLKPDRYDWLERRANQKGTGLSSLLRARFLEGIKKRNCMSQIELWLEDWKKRGENLYERADEISDEKVKWELKAFGREIEGKLDELRDSI
jgi:uncharacterized protein (DUF1778 family)